jgi:hypothetical protein
VWSDASGVIAALPHATGQASWVRLPGVGVFVFDAAEDKITAYPDAAATRAEVTEAYRRAVLPIIQHRRAHQVVHASAVRAAAGIVAFCGASGAGKSTLAYGFARRGYPLWGDDALCFKTKQGQIVTIALPFDLLLRPSTASFLKPSPQTTPIEPPAHESEAIVATAPLAAICVLRPNAKKNGTCAEIAQLAAVDAFRATLEHAYAVGLADQEGRKRLVEDYLQLVTITPVFDVKFTHGLDHLEKVVGAIEQRLGLEPPSA